MAAALGVNQRWLFTGVFALGALLAGLGGALAIPREPANLEIDLALIADAFVVVVVGGLGSIPGAFLAALLIGEVKAFCIALGYSKLTLAIEFIVMAVVLVLRPWGLLGRPLTEARGAALVEPPLGLPSREKAAFAAALALLRLRCRLFSGQLRAGAAHRHPGVRAVRRQPALHHGAGRHGLVRPRGLLRHRRLRRRPPRAALGRADGARAARSRRSPPLPARSSSAGSACGCPASTWRCSPSPSRRSPGRSLSSGTA